MSRLILHRAIGSPPARAVMMLGDILAIKFDIRDINIIKMEHKSPAFLKLETLLSGLAEPSDRHRAQIEASYRVVEAYLARTRHVAADSLTLADLSLGATATAIQCMHPIDNNLVPKYADWMARLEEETFFKTINREGADFFGKMFNALWKKNKMKNQLE